MRALSLYHHPVAQVELVELVREGFQVGRVARSQRHGNRAGRHPVGGLSGRMDSVGNLQPMREVATDNDEVNQRVGAIPSPQSWFAGAGGVKRT